MDDEFWIDLGDSISPKAREALVEMIRRKEMRTALENLALEVVNDGWSNNSNGDVTTFGREFWYSEIDDEFLVTYADALSNYPDDDDSLTPIIVDNKRGMFAVQNSDGIVTVTMTETVNDAKALFEDMLGNYQDFVAESEQNAQEDNRTINGLRFQ